MSALDTEGIDWAVLRELRTAYLDHSAGDTTYWTSASVLSAYDRTFGERIGWKWDYVLAELARRGWVPPAGPTLDWGCGTGVAGRRMVGAYPEAGPLMCRDRSARAEQYAREAAAGAGIEVATSGEPATVLVSHVISELDTAGIERVLEVVRSATAVVWVEPGDRENARALQHIRDRLLGEMSVVAPCTHRAPCPLLDESMKRHWCHHFAAAPPDAFTDPGWGRFVSETGIDLRSTPLSFIVMDRREVEDPGSGAMHTIGRPRVSKADARIFGCDENGVTDGRMTKRRMPAGYRAARKGRLDTLARWQVEDGEILTWEPW